MNEMNLRRKRSRSAFWKPCATIFAVVGLATRVGVVASLALILAGCAGRSLPSQCGSCDRLVGWYERTGSNSLIPVFKHDGTYFSVCRGFEIPFKESPEGLEWGTAPSSMTGTKIGWDAALKTHYLAVMDTQASNFTDGRYGCGEKETIVRIEKPAWLAKARARRPRTRDDLLGWYQPVWLPGLEIQIWKHGDRYFSTMQAAHRPGDSNEHAETRELTRLPDQLGFTGFERKGSIRLAYNEALKRFELVKTIMETTPSAIRMPLARVPAPPSPEGGHTSPPMVRIGIPSWH